MSITVNSVQDKYVHTLNPVEIMLDTTRRVSTIGTYFTRTITWINAPTTDDVPFDITFDDINVEMLSDATPIATDGLHYRKQQGAESLADWVAHFNEDIQSNYEIATYFDITGGPTTTIFTAKEKGVAGNIVFNAIPGTITTDYTLGTETLGVDLVYRPNFKMFLEVWWMNGVENKFLSIEMLPVGDDWSSGKTIYNFSTYSARLEDILHGYARIKYPVGVLSLTQINLEDYHLIRYKMRYYEYEGDPPTGRYYYNNTNSDDWFFALKGGLNADVWPASTFFTDYVIPDYKFLTWAKRNKTVFPDEPVWLYWIHTRPTEPTGINNNGYVELVITYDDETTDTVQIQEWSSGGQEAVFYFAAGYNQVVLAEADSMKTVVSYTVQVFAEVESAAAAALTEIFSFVLQTNIRPNWRRYIIFRNALSGFDTIACTGERSEGLDVSKTMLQKWMNADYEITDGKYVNSEADAKRVYQYNTGHFPEREAMRYAQDLLVNPEVAVVTPDATDETLFTVVPILIKKGSFKILKDRDMEDSFFIQFEAEDAYDYYGHSRIHV
ncbi:MAG: hypothetical protein KA954_10600 [Chitinophagales bacterium]|nr:hypothetical protein [Chitinophagales bacterium]MBP8754183.1 hypothetical protein [Chitinophagales bacterium]MBP9704661.1 hypothetical protein [Chitinophagales bacterium]